MQPPNDSSVLVRMPSDLKNRLLEAAGRSKRRITAEINLRLEQSFEPFCGSGTFSLGVAPPPGELTRTQVSLIERIRLLDDVQSEALLTLLNGFERK